MRNRRSIGYLFAAVGVVAGCVSMPRPEAPASSHPKASADFPLRIAVLPINNQAGDADGAMILRALAVHKLERDLGFTVQKPDTTDQIIRDRSLTGPEIPIQVVLARQDLALLATWLGVDGLLHGELQDFNRAKLGFYTSSQVKAHFWLTDKTGKTIWHNEQDSSSGSVNSGGSGVAIDSALFNSGIPPSVIDRIKQSPLGEITLDFIDQAFSTFPTQ